VLRTVTDCSWNTSVFGLAHEAQCAQSRLIDGPKGEIALNRKINERTKESFKNSAYWGTPLHPLRHELTLNEVCESERARCNLCSQKRVVVCQSRRNVAIKNRADDLYPRLLVLCRKTNSVFKSCKIHGRASVLGWLTGLKTSNQSSQYVAEVREIRGARLTATFQPFVSRWAKHPINPDRIWINSEPKSVNVRGCEIRCALGQFETRAQGM